jgi:hypothetical protein
MNQSLSMDKAGISFQMETRNTITTIFLLATLANFQMICLTERGYIYIPMVKGMTCFSLEYEVRGKIS